MTEPKPKPDQPPAPRTEGGQPAETPTGETGMVSEADGGRRAPAENERPGGMIGEG